MDIRYFLQDKVRRKPFPRGTVIWLFLWFQFIFSLNQNKFFLPIARVALETFSVSRQFTNPKYGKNINNPK